MFTWLTDVSHTQCLPWLSFNQYFDSSRIWPRWWVHINPNPSFKTFKPQKWQDFFLQSVAESFFWRTCWVSPVMSLMTRDLGLKNEAAGQYTDLSTQTRPMTWNEDSLLLVGITLPSFYFTASANVSGLHIAKSSRLTHLPKFCLG